MEFSKFIVPIYINNDYYGTGFIVNGMLITANHVVKNKLHTYFVFNGERHHVDINRIVAIDPLEKCQSTNEAHDLFVCLTDIEKSDLKLSSNFDKKSTCEFMAYSLNDDNTTISMDYIDDIEVYRNVALDSNYNQLINCLSCKYELKHTNSGGPLFQQGGIIGMLIRGIDHYGGFHESVFIKSSYIKLMIEKMTGKESQLQVLDSFIIRYYEE
jgi:hypothetical protein